MKKIMMLIVLMLVLTGYSQELSMIYLKNGDQIKGKVIETLTNPEPSIRVEIYASGSVMTIKYDDVLKIEVIPQSKSGSIGLGLGIPYGMVGANAEFNLADNFSLTGGAGSAFGEGFAYCVGAHLYFRGVGNTWRPRISAYYGVNAFLETLDENLDWEYEWYSGLNIGLGQQWMWGESKNHGLSLDLIIIATSGAFDEAERLEDEGYEFEDGGIVKVAIGYRYGF